MSQDMRRSWLFIGSSVSVGALAFVVLCAALGRGGRALFSPDTLDSAGQREVLIPFMQVPIYRSSPSHYRYKLTEYLIDKGYWSPSDSLSPKWITVAQWNVQWRDGDSLFHREFSRNHQQWIKWSDEQPELARVMWRVVLDALRTEVNTGRAFELMHCGLMSMDLEEFRVKAKL